MSYGSDLSAALFVTGASHRQAQKWLTWGWFHTPSLGSGHPYPWLAELRQLDWLARLSRSLSSLTDADAEAGYKLRVPGFPYAVRLDGQWRGVPEHLMPKVIATLNATQRAYSLTVVVRPEIEAMAKHHRRLKSLRTAA